ncbi:hypothetical protein [Tahibacter aquaticus]|jgi:hypothetical protein|uniref:hypothetical protein n=1 Tax=Tahibacter aquaticus TaxID=520092 RepID=UPI001414CC3A|nr:hypothetical protein [Tahibacter aquaticus]
MGKRNGIGAMASSATAAASAASPGTPSSDPIVVQKTSPNRWNVSKQCATHGKRMTDECGRSGGLTTLDGFDHRPE